MRGIYGRVAQPRVNQDQDNAICIFLILVDSIIVSQNDQLVRKKAGFYGRIALPMVILPFPQ